MHSVAALSQPKLRPAGGLVAVALAAPVLLAMILITTPARADFTAGVRAYEAGDYAAAYAQWLPVAEKNDVAAMRNIGHLYRWGQGVEKDIQKAMDWYRRAADLGFSRAQANLAAIYLQGEEGVPVNYEEAHKWFAAAAIQGHAVAQYNLGLMFELGLGVEKSEPRALGWYNLAAKNGQPEALDRLSQMVRKPEEAAPLVSGLRIAGPQAAGADEKTESTAASAAVPSLPPPIAAASAPVEPPVVQAAPAPAAEPAAAPSADAPAPAQPERPGFLARMYNAIASGGGVSIPDIFDGGESKPDEQKTDEPKNEPTAVPVDGAKP